MTFLSVCEQVAPKIGLDVPTTVIGNTDEEIVELIEVARDSVQSLLKARDWQVLKKVATVATGDGSTEAFDLPSDFDRMPVTANIRSTRLIGPYRHIADADEWLEIDIRDYEQTTGVWMLMGGQLQIKPAPPATEVIKYFYQSSAVVLDADNTTTRDFFDDDDDTLRIPERLLRLDMIWRWRQSHGLEWETHEALFMDALGEESAADKGARMIAVGQGRRPRGVRAAYPRSITG